MAPRWAQHSKEEFKVNRFVRHTLTDGLGVSPWPIGGFSEARNCCKLVASSVQFDISIGAFFEHCCYFLHRIWNLLAYCVTQVFVLFSHAFALFPISFRTASIFLHIVFVFFGTGTGEGPLKRAEVLLKKERCKHKLNVAEKKLLIKFNACFF